MQEHNDPVSSVSNDGMIRSQERLQVATTIYPTETVRLRKHIITEEKTITITVAREVFTLERAPITNPQATPGDDRWGSDLSQTHYEMVLHEEQVVVEKKVVPVERITILTDLITEQQVLTDQVRSERIETDTIAVNDSAVPFDQHR